MKKRILSLLLAIIMCVMMVPTTKVSAAQENPLQNFSDWAMNDLIVGDAYGVYPLTWYQKDMTVPISESKFRVLMAGIRGKILNTECVSKTSDVSYTLSDKMTVEKVLKTFYQLLSSYEFSGDVGIKDKSAITFMKENGVFTGSKEELGLKDTCSIEQACIFATRLVTAVYDKLDAASKGFFWVTKSGENTVYMLGSIHMATNDIYPFSKEILDAYASSDILGVELNLLDRQGPAQLAEIAVLTDGTTFKDYVSAETYDKTIALARMFGYSEDQMALLKPWYIYIMFASLASTESGNYEEATNAANLGIDVNFTLNSYYTGKPLVEVEGYAYQAQVLDSFSEELEEYLLVSTIDEINDLISGKTEDGSEDLDLMLELWRDGDSDTFKKFTSMEYEYPELYDQEKADAEKALRDEFKDKLITQRDKRMADYIQTLLRADGSKTYFIVVGSGHYISDYSVIDILEDNGFEVTQIK